MPKVEWHGEKILADCAKAAMDGMEEFARVDVLPLADESCPTDRGVMKGSHAVIRDGVAVMAGPHNEGDTFGGEKDQVVIGYGGAASAYVEKQHEDMTLSHPSGKAKWLEEAFNEKQGELPEKIKARLAGVLG